MNKQMLVITFKQFMRYNLVGIINVSLGYFVIFTAMGIFALSPLLSNFLGYCAALCTSFVLNKKFTFRSNGTRAQEISYFLITFCLCYLANLFSLYGFIYYMHFNQYISQFMSGVVYTVLFFSACKLVVFKSKLNYES